MKKRRLYLARPFRPAELSSEKYEWKTEYRSCRTVQIVDMSNTAHLESKTDTVLIVKKK